MMLMYVTLVAVAMLLAAWHNCTKLTTRGKTVGGLPSSRLALYQLATMATATTRATACGCRHCKRHLICQFKQKLLPRNTISVVEKSPAPALQQASAAVSCQKKPYDSLTSPLTLCPAFGKPVVAAERARSAVQAAGEQSSGGFVRTCDLSQHVATRSEIQ